ncbi:MAG: zf-HC2 domain-containing protein [Clostridia bacterium]|nr:zf-HC2 domain-containing protein [Clostridia bacterium]
MNCEKVLELLEEYVMNELTSTENEEIHRHLQHCKACAQEYAEVKNLVPRLQGLKTALTVKEGVLGMNQRDILKKTYKKSFIPRFLPGAAACLFFAVSVLTMSIIAFPTFASKVAPELPVVKEWVQAKEQNEQVKKEVVQMKEDYKRLEIELKKIKDTQIKEIRTSEGISPDENTAVQELVIDFIKAQYKGDLAFIKSMCTQDFKEKIEKRKSDVLMVNQGSVIFSTITNVAKDGDKYLVFVRLTDTSEKERAEYQLDFELVKENGKFLVAFVGKDA